MNKLKTFAFILIFQLLIVHSHAQDCKEFEIHKTSIDSTYYPGHIIDRTDTVFNANSAFMNFTIENLLNKASDKCYISNRNILKKLQNRFCDSTTVLIEDTLQNGETCKITIKSGLFKSKEHHIEANNDTSSIQKIDDQFPYGAAYGIPKVEIKHINIEINGISLKIPKAAYSNLYSPLFCRSFQFFKQIEAYESLNGKYLYVYIYGGNAADSYFSKLVFDRSGYKTRIISDYYPLSMHNSFRESFIGF